MLTFFVAFSVSRISSWLSFWKGLVLKGHEIQNAPRFVILRPPVLLADTWSPLSSAEAPLYRREGWRERKESPRGTMGRGKRRGDAPAFSLLASYPARFLFFIYYYFIGVPRGASAEERAWTLRSYADVGALYWTYIILKLHVLKLYEQLITFEVAFVYIFFWNRRGVTFAFY